MHAPHDVKVKLLGDPAQRAELRALADKVPYQRWTRWADSVVFDAEAPEVRRLVGRRIGTIAAERGQDPFDTLLDIVLADDLRTGVMTPTVDDYDERVWQKRAELLRDRRTVLGGSDAGAHLDMVQAFGCITNLIGPVVRETGVLPLEEAVHLATDRPARLIGLRDRGRLAPGWSADVVVFDPERFGPTPVEARHDLPGGAWRLTSEAAGLELVFVNGTLIREGSQATGALPGTVLRSGRDTA
jgi:N-acyl-D-aspartate/D-glutamate deacylase